MQVESIPVDCIRCGNRLRAVSPERVEALAGSMAELGLRTPISVQVIGEFKEADGSITMDVPILIAGLHRVEAAKKLGWEDIDAFVLDGDERDFRLWEIAENLHRAELSDTQRRQHLAEWVKITAEKVRHGDAPLAGGMQPTEAGIRKAAKELGLSEPTVRRAVAAESLTPEAKAAADEADIGTVKRAEIAREPSPEKQLQAILAERDRKEAMKANQETDRTIAYTDAQQFADWLRARTDVAEINTLIAWLQGTKAKDVITALRREAA